MVDPLDPFRPCSTDAAVSAVTAVSVPAGTIVMQLARELEAARRHGPLQNENSASTAKARTTTTSVAAMTPTSR